MDTRAPFIPHVEAAKLMEPGQRAFDDPARPTETTAMLGPTLRQLRLDAAAVKGVAVRLRIIAAVALHEIRLSPRAAGPAAQGRHRVHQQRELRDVMPVGGRQLRRKRNP